VQRSSIGFRNERVEPEKAGVIDAEAEISEWREHLWRSIVGEMKGSVHIWKVVEHVLEGMALLGLLRAEESRQRRENPLLHDLDLLGRER
jgi:hypothetical protein